MLAKVSIDEFFILDGYLHYVDEDGFPLQVHRDECGYWIGKQSGYLEGEMERRVSRAFTEWEDYINGEDVRVEYDEQTGEHYFA